MSSTPSPTPDERSPDPYFEPFGPLPSGTTLLEASAGTGKTHTIAALAARYVAEGVAELPRLLLVTFGRAATSELRERVRATLSAAHRGLREEGVRRRGGIATPTGPAPATGPAGALVRHLARGEEREVQERADRLGRALAQFDAATIATTHGFCQQMLASLGVLGDVAEDAQLVPDVGDLRREVVDDLYLQRYAPEAAPALTIADARAVATEAARDPQARLWAETDGVPGHRYAFARDVREELRRRKRAAGILDYDDLLVLLRDALADPEHGPTAAERLRSAYDVVMVDEFQDTDPVQWEILRTAFHGHTDLVLIGDPKQAIYAFRGGDVVTYLAARDDATARATLARNWRSDARLLAGVEHVLGGAALGDERIVVRRGVAEHAADRLTGAAAVRLRVPEPAAFGPGSPWVAKTVGAARTLVYRDVAADVVRQLSGEVRLTDGSPEELPRPLRPGDIAVLARRNADAAGVRDALVAAGVPAVQSGVVSVFATPAATSWLTLLVALEQPWNGQRAAAAALTPFLGWDAARLGESSEAERESLSETLGAWARVLAADGVGALLETVTAAGLAARLLSRPGGERDLVDLRHIAQALHAAAVETHLGTTAMVEWLQARTEEAERDYDEERSRRLETDADAVQVVTVHASKGLQFPVVYVPFAWDAFPRDGQALRFHDEAGTRHLAVGGSASDRHGEHRARNQDEELGEDLRLLYVALTRARSQVVLWWVPTDKNTAMGPLTRVLFGGHQPGTVPDARTSTWRRRPDATAALAALEQASDGTVTVEAVAAPPDPGRWEPGARALPALSVARLERAVDQGWRRSSFTALTATAHDGGPGVATEPEAGAVQDEVDGAPGAGEAAAPGGGDAGAPAGTEGPTHLRSPWSELPGGTGFGTLVHGVLERLDTEADDLDAELRERCREAAAGRPDAEVRPLAEALGLAVRTSLGPLTDGRRLVDVAPRDRLAELEFELPLAGGDGVPRTAAVVADLADALEKHLDAGDPFAAYPGRLRAGDLGRRGLRGYLTGSIDAVLRLEGAAGPRHVVVDYKTNRLGPWGEPLTTWHYRPEAMVEAMMAAHYPLQLLLYETALHRLLRWRLPGYAPDVHLGGGLYLFLRGMVGPGTPVVDGTPCGVLAWQPPVPLVLELSALLDGRRA